MSNLIIDHKVHRKRVLIGSCGGLTGIYLARRLKLNNSLEIWGADCAKLSAGAFFVDHFINLPPASEKGFIDALSEVLDRLAIDYYIPTHSSEVRTVSESERRLKEVVSQTKFMVCPFETFQQLDDKRSMSRSFNNAGIPTPVLFGEIAEIESFPVFMKQSRGSGGIGTEIIASRAACEAAAIDYPDALFFEFVEGPELTVDCMFDSEGMLLGFNQRRRVKTMGGAAIITTNDYSFDLEPWLFKISSLWKFKGCVNFQCIVKDGVPLFTDVNLRFPSGGLPLSVESGLDVPQMLIKLLSGDQVKVGEYCSDRLPRTMFRVFDELFEVAR